MAGSRIKDLIFSVAEAICFILILPLVLLWKTGQFRYASFATALSLIPSNIGVIIRRVWYRCTLAGCGRKLRVEFLGWIRTHRTRVGDNVYIGVGSFVGFADVGNNIMISTRVVVLSGLHQHNIDRPDVPMSESGGGDTLVRIGNDVWIGAGAIVGADVAQGCVVGTGAVVIKPTEPRTVVAGVPAKIIKRRFEDTALENEPPAVSASADAEQENRPGVESSKTGIVAKQGKIMSAPLPNLFMPGAQKSATTTAAGILASHRDIYVGAFKEPHFFSIDRRFNQGVSFYNPYYKNWNNERYVLDGSQCYMPIPLVPGRMAKMLGTDLKFIIILRHPVDRAMSAFAHMRIREGGEVAREIHDIVPKNLDGMSLDDLLEFEANEVRRCLKSSAIIERYNTWTQYQFPFNYFKVSAYSWQIENFLRYFPEDRFLFMRFKDVARDQEDTKKQLAAFLDIDPDGFASEPAMIKNETLRYKIPALRFIKYLKEPLRHVVPEPIAGHLRTAERKYLTEKPDMAFDEHTYRLLCDIFSDEIDRVAEITGLDIEFWKDFPTLKYGAKSEPKA